MSYEFKTPTLFLLAKFVKYFESDLGSILAAYASLGEDDTNIAFVIQTALKVIGKLPEAEETAMELMASATRRSIKDVREMDAYDFLREFQEFLRSIKWDKLMGESLGLVLEVPKTENKEDQAKSE